MVDVMIMTSDHSCACARVISSSNDPTTHDIHRHSRIYPFEHDAVNGSFLICDPIVLTFKQGVWYARILTSGAPLHDGPWCDSVIVMSDVMITMSDHDVRMRTS